MHPHPYWKQNSIAALPSTDSNQGPKRNQLHWGQTPLKL